MTDKCGNACGAGFVKETSCNTSDDCGTDIEMYCKAEEFTQEQVDSKSIIRCFDGKYYQLCAMPDGKYSFPHPDFWKGGLSFEQALSKLINCGESLKGKDGKDGKDCDCAVADCDKPENLKDVFLKEPVEKVIPKDGTAQGSGHWDVYDTIEYTAANYTALGKRPCDNMVYVRIDANIIGTKGTTGVLVDGDNLHKFKVTTSGSDAEDDNTVMRIGWLPINSAGGNVFSGTRWWKGGGNYHSAVKVQILGFKQAVLV